MPVIALRGCVRYPVADLNTEGLSMIRLLALLVALSALASCTNPNDLDKAPVPLGDFRLGHNVVVAPNLTKGPASREASKEEWIEAMKSAVDERFSRFDGDSLYHLGISVEGYVLAVPGVPIVASPKSALIIKVTAWDDAEGVKLNEEPETVTVVESISGPTLLGSGLTQSKETQMSNLSRNAAKLIQNWLVREHNANGWFEPEPDASRDDAQAGRDAEDDEAGDDEVDPETAENGVPASDVIDLGESQD